MKWKIKKRSKNRWEVLVPVSTVSASISFWAPFSSYSQAVSYVRFYLDKEKS
jgi:hypothetical protein